MPTLETKTIGLDVAELDLRSAGVDSPVTFRGYASTFGGDPDSHGDLISPGAYAATITEYKARGRWPALRLEHEGPIVGRFTNLAEDAKGLLCEAQLTPGLQAANDTAALLRHGALDGLSAGFVPVDFEWRSGMPRIPRRNRVLKSIKLFHIALVGEPSNDTARVIDVKSMGLSLREIENKAREDWGLSRRETEILSDHGMKALLRHWEASGVGSTGDDAPRDEAGVADVLAAMTAVRQILQSRIA